MNKIEKIERATTFNYTTESSWFSVYHWTKTINGFTEENENGKWK